MSVSKAIINEVETLLVDSGCDKTIIQQILEVTNQCDITCAIPLLNQYKRNLLKTIHAKQQQLDNLDYLIYQIKKGIIK